MDEIRRVRRRRESPNDAAFELLADRGADPATEASSRELGAAIRACLLRLAESRKLAVTLYLLGHTVPESARNLGWPLKKAENMVYRGLADLRRCLARKGFTP